METAPTFLEVSFVETPSNVSSHETLFTLERNSEYPSGPVVFYVTENIRVFSRRYGGTKLFPQKKWFSNTGLCIDGTVLLKVPSGGI